MMQQNLFTVFSEKASILKKAQLVSSGGSCLEKVVYVVVLCFIVEFIYHLQHREVNTHKVV